MSSSTSSSQLLPWIFLPLAALCNELKRSSTSKLNPQVVQGLPEGLGPDVMGELEGLAEAAGAAVRQVRHWQSSNSV